MTELTIFFSFFFFFLIIFSHVTATTTWIDPRTNKSEQGTQSRLLLNQKQKQTQEEQHINYLQAIATVTRHKREDSGQSSGSGDDITLLREYVDSTMV